MSPLSQYVLEHVERFACRCDRCLDPGEDRPLGEHTADVVFFQVSLKNEPTVQELEQLCREHQGEFCDLDLFDGGEHSYLQIGGWIGDQGLALMLMGMGQLLGMWQLTTPKSVFGEDIPVELISQMAGLGFISVGPRLPSQLFATREVSSPTTKG